MRKTFVTATVTAAVCSLAISVAPALGQDSEFSSETLSTSETTSSTAQIFRVGTSGWVECAKIKLKSSPELGVSTTLKVKIESYTTCSYNHSLLSEVVTTIEPKCPVVLESELLEELSVTEFGEGLAKFHCTLKFFTSLCKVEFEEHLPALPEFAWTNTNTTAGHFESLLKMRMEKLTYKISSGCGSNGTNGEWDGSIPIEHVIVLPTL